MKNKQAIKFTFWQTLAFLLGAVLLTLWGTRVLGEVREMSNKGKQGTEIKKVGEITPAQLKILLASKNFTFINVHTPYEGEIEKTDLLIDYDKIEENKEKLPMGRSGQIILYCQTGRMSEIAAQKLIDLGYTNVSHLVGGMEAWRKVGYRTFNVEDLQRAVLPEKGISAPVKWGNLGPTLISLGVIDLEKFKKAVNPTEEQLAILTSFSDKPITIDNNNSQFVVDMLWALGLAQKSKVYTDGPMGKEYKKDVGNFASTGGWSLAKKEAVSYLNNYEMVRLTSDQQDRVFELGKNIFRPCCGNHTSFPDCNHGMAALGLVELMVAEGYSDQDIYRTVLGFNSFWFPQNYIAIAADYSLKGISWDKVEAKEALSQTYSSAQGAARVSKEVGKLPYLYRGTGGGCGI